jgi:hypothetical protein
MDWEEWEEKFGIDADELDEMVEELFAQDQFEEAPSFRATIRDGRIWLRAWSPAMSTPNGNPGRPVAPDVAVADLTVAEVESESGRRDLIARFHFRSTGGDDEGPLIDWASRTGYSMLWLPDRLVKLEIDPNRLGAASTHCPTCGAHWTQDDPAFWAEVLRHGYFPDTCNYCGCALPEWIS